MTVESQNVQFPSHGLPLDGPRRLRVLVVLVAPLRAESETSGIRRLHTQWVGGASFGAKQASPAPRTERQRTRTPEIATCPALPYQETQTTVRTRMGCAWPISGDPKNEGLTPSPAGRQERTTSPYASRSCADGGGRGRRRRVSDLHPASGDRGSRGRGRHRVPLEPASRRPGCILLTHVRLVVHELGTSRPAVYPA